MRGTVNNVLSSVMASCITQHLLSLTYTRLAPVLQPDASYTSSSTAHTPFQVQNYQTPIFPFSPRLSGIHEPQYDCVSQPGHWSVLCSWSEEFSALGSLPPRIQCRVNSLQQHVLKRALLGIPVLYVQ